MGAYDWLPGYANLAAIAKSQPDLLPTLQQMIADNPNGQQLLASGAINLPQAAAPNPYESGPGPQQPPPIDWSKLPQMGPGGDTPANTMWAQVNSNNRVDPWTMKPVGPDPKMGGTYNDPNYGLLQLIQRRAPDDPIMKYGRMGVIGLVSGGMAMGLAPLLASALGLGQGSVPLIASLLRAVPGLAQGGNPLQVAGSLAGGATGIPGGSMLGGVAGSYLGSGH
jgi:hypothetical protein